MPTFTAHRFSLENVLFPNRLEITLSNVIYFKGNVFGYQSSIIARNNIASVSIDSKVFFADVLIESYGGKKVVATGFKKSDAREIVRLLT